MGEQIQLKWEAATIELRDGQLIDCDVNYTVVAIFHAGEAAQLCGPPERCYPGSPSWYEIDRVTVDRVTAYSDAGEPIDVDVSTVADFEQQLRDGIAGELETWLVDCEESSGERVY